MLNQKKKYWLSFFVLVVVLMTMLSPKIAYARDCPGVKNPWNYAENTGYYTGCATCGGTWVDKSDVTGYARIYGKNNAITLANSFSKLRGVQIKNVKNADGSYQIEYYKCKNCGVCTEYSKLLATEYYNKGGEWKKTEGSWDDDKDCWTGAGPGYVPWWLCTECGAEATSPANVRTITHLHFPDMVSFNTNGSPDSFESIKVMYNTAYGMLPTPSWEGYIFRGWVYGGQEITSITIQRQNKDHTIKALWEADIPSPTPEPIATPTPTVAVVPTEGATNTPTPTPDMSVIVVFHPSGGTVNPTSKKVIYGKTYGELPVPEREGYEFYAWKHEESNTIVSSNTSVLSKTEHTLKAIWIQKVTPSPTPTPTEIPDEPSYSRETEHESIRYFTTDAGYTLNSIANNKSYELATYQSQSSGGSLSSSSYTIRPEDYLIGTDENGNTWYFLENGTNATYVHPAVYKGNNANSSEIKNITELVFPSVITYNGTSYTVVSIGGGSATYHIIRNDSSDTSTDTSGTYTTFDYKPEIGSYDNGMWESTSSKQMNKDTSIMYLYGVVGNGEITSVGTNHTSYSNGKYEIIRNVNSYYVYNTTLQSVTIPDSVTEILSGAFEYCQALKEIKGAKNVKVINYAGFRAVAEIDRVSKISKDYVQNGYSNKLYYYYNTSYSFLEKTDVMIAFDSTVPIAPYLTLPQFNTLTTIGTYGFANHNNLYDVKLGSAVSNIGTYAFAGCKLDSIQIENDVATIGKQVTTLGTKGKVENRTIIYTEPNSTAMSYGLDYREYYELYCGYPIIYEPNGALGEAFVQNTRLKELYLTLDVTEFYYNIDNRVKVYTGVDGEGNLWFIDALGTMEQVSKGTKFTKIFKGGEIKKINGKEYNEGNLVYAYDSEGYLWVTGQFKKKYYTDYDTGETTTSYGSFCKWKRIEGSNSFTNVFFCDGYALFAINSSRQLVYYRNGMLVIVGEDCPPLETFVIYYGSVSEKNVYYGIDTSGQKWKCPYKEDTYVSESWSPGTWIKASWYPPENDARLLEYDTETREVYIGYEFSDIVKDKNIIADRSGYTFVEWNTAVDGTGISYQPGDTVTLTESLRLYAKWKADRQLSYFPNGGTGTMIPSLPVTEDSTDIVVATNTFIPPIGYKFYAWNTVADRTGQWHKSGDTIYNVAGTYKLYAQWKFIQYTIQFGATEFEDGTEISVSRPVDYGSSFQLATKSDKTIKLYYDYNNDGMSTTPVMTGTSKEYDKVTLTFLGWKLYKKTVTGYERVNYILYASGQTVKDLTTVDGEVLVFFPDWNGTGSVTLPTLKSTGYTFQGWAEEQNEQDYANAKNGTYTFSDTMTVYAMWKPKEYTITLNGQGATYLPQSSVTMTFDSVGPNIELPTKNGYLFDGYFTEPNGGGEEYYDEAGQTTKTWTIADGSVTTLYAKWTPVDYSMYLNPHKGYFIEADGSKNTAMKRISLTYETTDGADLSDMLPKRIGYTFAGWYTQTSGGVQVHDKNGYRTNDGTYFKNGLFIYPNGFTLFARWDANRYTVTIDLNKLTGTGTVSIPHIDVTVTFDSANHIYNGTDHSDYLSSNLPTRSGYDFVGLYDAPTNGTMVYDSSGNVVNDGTYFKDGVYVYPDDVTLYAYWTPKKYTITFDWNFDWDSGGTDTNTNWTGSTKVVTYDSTYGTLPNPTREGYEFIGWFLEEDSEGNGAGTEVGILTPVTTAKNHTLYARWSMSYMEEADVWLKPLRQSTWVAAVADGEVGLCKMKEYGNTMMNVTVTTDGYFDYLQVNVPWANPIIVKFEEGIYEEENDIWYLAREDYIQLFADVDPDIVRKKPGYKNEEYLMTVDFYKKDGTVIITYQVKVIFIPYDIWKDEIIVGREPVTEDE